MEDHVALCEFLDPVGRQRVDEASDDGQRGHDADGHVVGDLILEVCAHRYGRKEHLGCAVLGGGDASDLAEEIDPAG